MKNCRVERCFHSRCWGQRSASWLPQCWPCQMLRRNRLLHHLVLRPQRLLLRRKLARNGVRRDAQLARSGVRNGAQGGRRDVRRDGQAARNVVRSGAQPVSSGAKIDVKNRQKPSQEPREDRKPYALNTSQ
jgi:hypothetical protein